MQEINFVCGGMLGDFIHSMAAIKNICEKQKCKANIYISNDLSKYGGDNFKEYIYKTHVDLSSLITNQPFVNSFNVAGLNFNQEFININNWRHHIASTHSANGYYTESWSELLSNSFSYSIPDEYKWLNAREIKKEVKNKVVIHRSIHRHNPNFNWISILEQIEGEIIFLTSNEAEWIAFPYKHDNVKLKLVDTVSDMADCINSCKLFIGNQSAPFAIASALDVNRIVELDAEPAVFYMGESKYSKNISWYLNSISNHIAENSKIKF